MKPYLRFCCGILLLLFVSATESMAQEWIQFSTIYWTESGEQRYSAKSGKKDRQIIPVSVGGLEAGTEYRIGISSSRLSDEQRREGVDGVLNVEGIVDTIDINSLQEFRSAGYEGNNLVYQLYPSRQGVQALTSSLAAPQVLLPVEAHGRSEWQGTLFLEVFEQQWVPPGRYTDVVELLLYRRSDTGLELVTSRKSGLVVDVPEQWGFTVNEHVFHDNMYSNFKQSIPLNTTKDKREINTELIVYSNIPYVLELSAENGMAQGEKRDSEIPYRLSVNNGPVLDMKAKRWVRVANAKGGGAQHYDIQVKVLGDEQIPEDVYEDFLHVQLSVDP